MHHEIYIVNCSSGYKVKDRVFGEPERKLRDQVRDHKSSLGEKESEVDHESSVEKSKGATFRKYSAGRMERTF